MSNRYNQSGTRDSKLTFDLLNAMLYEIDLDDLSESSREEMRYLDMMYDYKIRDSRS